MATVIERDVIVVGAGPAGAVCAAYMARAGLDVLLIDKEIFPRDKACGDMVKEGFVKHIERLEAVDVLDEMSTCIRKLKLISAGGHEAVVPFECYSVPRYKLDKLLVDTAISWGAEFRQGCRVVDVIRECDEVCGVIVREKGVEREIRSSIVIGADGVNSDFGKIIGAMDEESSAVWLGQRAYFKGVKLDRSLSKEQYDAGGIFGFDDKPGPAYFWVMPTGADGVKRGICNVGMIVKGRDAYKASELAARMEAWLDSNEKLQEMFGGAEKISPWAFGKLTDVNQQRRPAGDGYMLIGDAAAQMIPLTNDGLTAAANSAKAAADAAEAAFKEDDFSEEFLLERYVSSLTAQQGGSYEAAQNKKKLDDLLMESMNDPKVKDMIVERLAFSRKI